MASTEDVAKEVAENLIDGGEFVILVSDAFNKVKQEGGFSAPWKDHVVRGFEKRGWERSGDVLYRPEKLQENSEVFAQKLQSEGRPVVSRSVVSSEIANEEFPRDNWGSEIDEAFEKEGWEIDEKNGLYYLPMNELVSESSLAHYILGTFSFNSDD